MKTRKLKHVLTGRRFGRLSVVFQTRKNNVISWSCKCDCGVIKIIPTGSLVNGLTTSCGCYFKEKNGSWNETHGLSRTPTGSSWHAMLMRCYNQKYKKYKNYGGRGIVACEFLRASPLNLSSLIGSRPDGTTLDRINVNLGYTCGMCAECLKNGNSINIRWSDATSQGRNRRDSVTLEINGVTKHIHDWAEEFGVPNRVAYTRLKKGWPLSDLFKPVKGASNN